MANDKDDRETPASLRRAGHRGGTAVIGNELKALRQRLIEYMVARKGMNNETATHHVDSFFIRLYVTDRQEKLSATPEGVRLWLDVREHDHVPFAQAGEISSKQLSERYLVGREDINKEFTHLRNETVADLMEGGFMNKNAATAAVDHFLVGMRKPETGVACLHATPYGLEIWQKRYPRKLRKNAAPDADLKAGELSASKLAGFYVGGSQSFDPQLKELRQKLIDEIVDCKTLHMSRKEAAVNVDAFLIGPRKPIKGPEALHATPDGRRIWVEEYDRKRRPDTPAPPAPKR